MGKTTMYHKTTKGENYVLKIAKMDTKNYPKFFDGASLNPHVRGIFPPCETPGQGELHPPCDPSNQADVANPIMPSVKYNTWG